jgi:muramoyltetrapeptide carboxypeptidase
VTLIKPRRLRRGSLLAVVSPASTPKPELVAAGVAGLEALGYRVRVSPHTLDRGPLYYAGTLEDRLADLHAAFADPEVDGIICARGGWGSAELLPHLDRALIAAHPKPFLGYSDQTSLHLWLRNEIGLVSFQAPMVAADLARPDGADPVSWRAALEATEPWSLGTESGLRVLRAGNGVAEGDLHGGCLAIYAEALGTPFAPVARGGVLFLEDIGVKPYQWDRMLLHCRYAGLLEGVQGIILGDMAQSCLAEEHPLLEAAILHALAGFAGPIAIGLRSGHVAVGNVTLPFGVRVRLDLGDAENPRMHFLEAAVSE